MEAQRALETPCEEKHENQKWHWSAARMKWAAVRAGGYRKGPRPQGENDGEEAGSERIVGTADTRV